MNITASSVYDLKAIKTFYRTSMFLFNPRVSIIFYNILLSIPLISLITIKIIFRESLIDVVLILGISWILYMNYMYFIVPGKRYKAMCKFNEFQNKFTFCDDYFKVEVEDDEFNGMNKLNYSIIYKVTETKEYFYIYQNKNQSLIVDKSTIQGGTLEDLREVLRKAVGKKYRVCKY